MRIWQKFLGVGIVVMIASLVVGMSDVAYATGTPTLTTLDSTGNVGLYDSMELASGGKPVISYYDFTNGDLKLLVCNTAACTSPNISVLDSDAAGYTSLALKSGDVPVISYLDSVNNSLKLAICNNAACTSPTITVVDLFGFSKWTSVALASGDVPVISYYDFVAQDLKLAVCDNAMCTNPTIRTLDSTGDVGQHTSLVLASGDLPIISYYDFTNGDLKLVHCNDSTCSSYATATVDSTDNVGMYPSLALASGDVPVISYLDFTNGNLELAYCDDLDCFYPTTTTVDTPGWAGYYSSLALTSGDVPVISYRRDNDLMLAVCDDSAPSPTISTVDNTGNVGYYTSLALASGDVPVISYADAGNQDLKLASFVPVPPAPRPAKPPTVVVTPTVPTVAPTVAPVLPYAATAPYDADGNLRTDTLPTGYLTFDALGITTQPLLTDTVSISLTTQFLVDTPQWSLANAQPATILGKRAIRDVNNTVKPKYADLKPVTYAETGFALAGYVLDFWQRSGGTTTLGFPVSEPYVMDDPTTGNQMVVQYTERGRLEQPILQDGSYGLPRLGRLGAEYLAQQDSYPVAALPVMAPDSSTGITYFGVTGHTLQGEFADYFTTNGGLAQNGYPLTEPFIETYPEYPYPVTVQYFERVRMEYHGDPADPLYGQMTLGRIGAAVYVGNQP